MASRPNLIRNLCALLIRNPCPLKIVGICLQLFDYELDTSQVWQIWPTDQDVSTFMSQSGSTLISVIIDGYCSPLLQALVDMQTSEQNLQQTLISNVNALQANLLAFNSTTLIDNNFARYLICLGVFC